MVERGTVGTNPTLTSTGTPKTQRRTATHSRPLLLGRHYLCFANRLHLERPTGRVGLRRWQHLLASISSLDGCRRLAGDLAKHSQRAGTQRARGLLECDHRQRQCSCRFWGVHTGPNPTDRAKNGCKRHLITDAQGIPLTLITTPANVSDGQVAIPLLDSIPPIRQGVGRPRFRPDIFQGDRGYGWEDNIQATLQRGIVPLLARPRDDTHGSGLGQTRWVVESALSWFNHHRRLRLCYERSDKSFLAFHQLAAALICHGKLIHG